MLDVLSLFPLTSSVFVFVVALYIYYHNRTSPVNGLFFLFSLIISIFLAATGFLLMSESEEVVLFWERIVYSAVVFIPSTAFHLSLVVRQRPSLLQKALMVVGYLLSLFFLYLIIFTAKVIDEVYRYSWGYHSQAQEMHNYLLVFFFLYPIFVFWNLFQSYLFARSEQKKERAKLLMVAFFVLVFSSVAFLPAYGISVLPVFSYAATLFFTLTIAYGISRYHMIKTDVQILVTQFFVIFIILVAIMEILISRNFAELVVKVIFLIVTVIFGFFVIRNVKQSVKQRRQAEILAKKTKALNKQLLRLDREKSEMLSIVSHQLRTPLTAMRGYLSLLEEEISTGSKDAVLTSLNKVSQITDRLSQLVNNLLNTSRIDQGRMKYQFVPTDLTALVKEVADTFDQMARDRGLQIILNMPDKPLPLVELDVVTIREVVSNLVDNAIKYSPQGSIMIRLWRSGENQVSLSVKDTGVGIAPESISTIFSKFVRADKKNLNSQGTGLGLYVCHNIIKAHGGTIRVESKGEGKGTTFVVRLPIKRESPLEEKSGKPR